MVIDPIFKDKFNKSVDVIWKFNGHQNHEKTNIQEYNRFFSDFLNDST